MRSKILTSCLVIGVLFVTGSTLRAQGTNAPALTSPKPGTSSPAPTAIQPRMRAMPPGGGGPLSAFTEQQRASFEHNMNEQREALMKLNSKLQAARQEIGDAMFSTKVDEKLIRQKVMDAAKIEADMAVVRAQAFADIQPPITPDELEKFKHFQSSPMVRPMPPRPTPTPGSTNHAANILPPKQ